MSVTVTPGIYINGMPAQEWNAKYHWCESNIKAGQWWITDAGEFRFKRQEDRSFYLLRWGK